MIYIEKKELVSVEVIYFLPTFSNLVNSFYWQTLDVRPKYPRINKFLDFWRKEINAVIKEITICDMPTPEVKRWRNGIIIPMK
jgi:uncharacterized protein Usg